MKFFLRDCPILMEGWKSFIFFDEYRVQNYKTREELIHKKFSFLEVKQNWNSIGLLAIIVMKWIVLDKVENFVLMTILLLKMLKT